VKRSIWGIAILVALLILGIAIAAGMGNVHEGISDLLEQDATAAELGNWQQAEELTRQAEGKWQQYHHFTAAFADHTPMDELDGLFAELMIFLKNRESPHFASTCARLSLLAQAMADSHGLQWWNLL
jgi:hypothetical protein